MKENTLIVMYPNAATDVYGNTLTELIAQRSALLHEPLSADELAKRPDLLEQADAMFSGWGAPVMDDAFLRKAPRLRAVFYAAGTIRGWITDAVWERGIKVTTAAHANAIPVAEYTVAAILFSLKRAWFYAFEAKRLGRLPAQQPCAGAYRSKIGLISLGAVARLALQRLKTNHQLEILAYDPYVSPDEAAALGVKLVSLDTIFRECDVVSLHTPLIAATRGMIGREHFVAMRSGATFINTARGEIVREPELIEILKLRPDITAVLDVTFPEPPLPGSPLFALPNVVLTPHIAGSLGAECRRLGETMVEEFERWTSGQALKWQVTKQQSELLA